MNLVEPWILLLLKQWSGHGYRLLQSLNQLGVGPVDHTVLYKELRNLEKRGLVSSTWFTGGGGPARRTYTLTEAGERLLTSWAETVSGYQRMLAAFFQLYSAVLEGFAFNLSADGSRAGRTQSKRKANKIGKEKRG